MYYASNKKVRSTGKAYYQLDKEKKKDCSSEDKECIGCKSCNKQNYKGHTFNKCHKLNIRDLCLRELFTNLQLATGRIEVADNRHSLVFG